MPKDPTDRLTAARIAERDYNAEAVLAREAGRHEDAMLAERIAMSMRQKVTDYERIETVRLEAEERYAVERELAASSHQELMRRDPEYGRAPEPEVEVETPSVENEGQSEAERRAAEEAERARAETEARLRERAEIHEGLQRAAEVEVELAREQEAAIPEPEISHEPDSHAIEYD